MAGLYGKQVGNDSLSKVPAPYSSPFTTMVTERKRKVLTPDRVIHGQADGRSSVFRT